MFGRRRPTPCSIAYVHGLTRKGSLEKKERRRVKKRDVGPTAYGLYVLEKAPIGDALLDTSCDFTNATGGHA